MKYSDETINKNKETIHSLLALINRPNANIEGLLIKLDSSDFFSAPASTKYHNACRGGLADHSLNVYYNLKSLVKNKGLEEIIPEESIIICGLLHDMAKMNFYEPTARNKKVYSDRGTKYDELGNFEWVAELGYAVKDEKERFMYGNHEQNSTFMVKSYIPLKLEEEVAILNHHGGMGFDSTKMNISGLFHAYPLLLLLHEADMLATYIDEE